MMVCDLTNDTSLLIQVTVVTVVDGFGILLNLVSLLLLLCINRIDSSLREILVSFQVANLLGGALVTHDTIATLCVEDRLELTSISILLTVGHLTKLLAVEHTILTSSLKKGSGESFGGLIFTSWLLSVSVGVLNSSLPYEEYGQIAYVVFSFGVMGAFATVMVIYMKVIRKNHWFRRRLLVVRGVLLDRKHPKNISPKSYPELKYVPLIFISYIVFTMPWILQKIYEGATRRRSQEYLAFMNLLLFAFCFYFPAFVYILLWLKQRNGKIGAIEDKDENQSDTEGSFLNSMTNIFDRMTNPFGGALRDESTIFSYSYTHS